MFGTTKNPPSTTTRILEIIPYVMRVIASELRQNSPSVMPAHFRLLGMLSHRTWTLSELAETQAVSAPTMSTTITTLEERGWVTRVRSEEDRRVVLIQATDEGREIIQEAFGRVEQRISGILEALESDDRETLARGLDILRQAFEAVSDDCPDEVS